MPFADISAERRFFVYDRTIKGKSYGGEWIMKHVYFRIAMTLLWVVVGVINMNPLFLIVGAVFGWSAYDLWKKTRDGGEGR